MVANRQLIAMLKPGDRILVLDRAPLSPWKKVMLIGEESRIGWSVSLRPLGAIRLE